MNIEETLNGLIGLPIDQIRLVFSLIISYIGSYPIPYMAPNLRLAYSTITGLLIQLYVYNYSSIYLFIQTIFVYLLIVLKKDSPKIFGYSLGKVVFA